MKKPKKPQPKTIHLGWVVGRIVTVGPYRETEELGIPGRSARLDLVSPSADPDEHTPVFLPPQSISVYGPDNLRALVKMINKHLKECDRYEKRMRDLSKQ